MVQYIMDERDGGEQPQRPLMMIRRFSSPGYDAKLNHQSSLGPQSLRRTQSLQERYTVSPHSLRSVNSLVRARIEAARSCGRDSKQLSEETEQMRERLTQQRTLNRLVSSRELADENRQLRRRLSATGGRDVKALSEQTELARSRSIQRRRSENEARSASLREANAVIMLSSLPPSPTWADARLGLEAILNCRTAPFSHSFHIPFEPQSILTFPGLDFLCCRLSGSGWKRQHSKAEMQRSSRRRFRLLASRLRSAARQRKQLQSTRLPMPIRYGQSWGWCSAGAALDDALPRIPTN